MMKRIRLKPCNDLDRDLRDNIIERGWTPGKREDENKWNREFEGPPE